LSGQHAKREWLVINRVRVVSNASTDEIVGLYDGRLKLRVCVVPENGKVNKAVIEISAKHSKDKNNAGVLLSGQTSSRKMFVIRSASEVALSVSG
jgi:uncharacterized protein YggU (UPF0235/DUF167 family)